MKKIIFLSIFLFFIQITCFSSESIQKIEQLNDSAKYFYKQKDYEKSLSYYLKIEKLNKISANLYYNIGNCYFRLKNISKAILYYERALKLSPNDNDIRYNLQLANAYVTDKINEVAQPFYKQWFLTITHLFSPDTWVILSIVTFSICLICVYLIFISRSMLIINISKSILLICFVLFFISIISSYARYKEVTAKDKAIITADVVEVNSSPDEKSTVLFVLHEGTKVLITNEYEDWYEIKIADGNSGWLKKENLEII